MADQPNLLDMLEKEIPKEGESPEEPQGTPSAAVQDQPQDAGTPATEGRGSASQQATDQTTPASPASPYQPAQGQPAQAPQEQQFDPVAYFRETYAGGQDVGIDDPKALIDNLAGAYLEAQQVLQQLQQQVASEGGSQEPSQGAQQEDLPLFLKPLPDLPPGAEALLRIDEQTGRYVPVEGSNAWDLAKQANEALDIRRQKLDLLLSKPEEALGPLIERKVQEIASHLIQQTQQEQQLEQRLNQFVERHQQRDEHGNPVFDAEGRPVLTPEGNMAYSILEGLLGGTIDTMDAFEALASVLGQAAVSRETNQTQQAGGSSPQQPVQQQPQQATPEQINQQRRQQLLSAAAQPSYNPAQASAPASTGEPEPVGPATLRKLLEQELADVPLE